MQLNLTEIRKQATNIFDNSFYDAIVEAAKQLFPGHNVVKWNVKERQICIKDRVNIDMIISWNEPKIYIHSYIMEAKTEEEKDTWYKISKQNYSFRFFALEEIVNYLYIKVQENEFIKNNEG